METLQTALKILTPILLAALGVLLALLKVRANGEKITRVKACAAAKKIIEPVLFGLLTEAENAYLSGAGAEKLAFVQTKALGLLPERLRALVPVEWLNRIIETALYNAKKRWEAAAALTLGHKETPQDRAAGDTTAASLDTYDE